MAKEIIPPDPLPIGEEVEYNQGYCVSFVDCAKDGYDRTSIELLEYLDKVYGESEYHGSSKLYIAHDTTIDDVKEDILSAKIYGIDEESICDYVYICDYTNNLEPNIEVDESDVIICLLFY